MSNPDNLPTIRVKRVATRDLVDGDVIDFRAHGRPPVWKEIESVVAQEALAPSWRTLRFSDDTQVSVGADRTWSVLRDECPTCGLWLDPTEVGCGECA